MSSVREDHRGSWDRGLLGSFDFHAHFLLLLVHNRVQKKSYHAITSFSYYYHRISASLLGIWIPYINIMSKPKQENFSPQQSTRVSTVLTSDNDIWTEYLAVVEMLDPTKRNGKYHLQIRSFFESSNTGKKAWDEPPSGATNIIWASEEARNLAELQLKDVKIIDHGNSVALGMDNSKTLQAEPTNSDTSDKKPKSWKGKINSLFKKNKKDSSSDYNKSFTYEKSSYTDVFSAKSKNSKPKDEMDINDVNLQIAMAESIAKTEAKVPLSTEDEDLEMAKALSLSEAHQYR